MSSLWHKAFGWPSVVSLLDGPKCWWPSRLAKTDGAAQREEPVQVRA